MDLSSSTPEPSVVLPVPMIDHCAGCARETPNHEPWCVTLRVDHPTPMSPEWIAETVRLANESEADIADRIATGMIPPRPSTYDGEAFTAWFMEHLACAMPSHRFFVRSRGSRYCSTCRASLTVLS